MKNDKAQEKTSLIFTGEEHDVFLPSGKRVTIRETNGEDDAILSRIKDVSDSSAMYNFLSGIIIMDHESGKKPTSGEIMEWLNNDCAYLLFKQRIINLGPELEIKHICENQECKKESEYTEDLSEMDGDLSQKDYKPKSQQIPKYSGGSSKTIEYLSSKKNRFRFDLLNGMLQKKNLDSQAADDIDINSPLYHRNICLFENGKWVHLFDMRRFPSKETNELRTFLKKEDKPFSPIISFSCPKCQTLYKTPIMNLSVFYFPGDQT